MQPSSTRQHRNQNSTVTHFSVVVRRLGDGSAGVRRSHERSREVSVVTDRYHSSPDATDGSQTGSNVTGHRKVTRQIIAESRPGQKTTVYGWSGHRYRNTQPTRVGNSSQDNSTFSYRSRLLRTCERGKWGVWFGR